MIDMLLMAIEKTREAQYKERKSTDTKRNQREKEHLKKMLKYR